MIVVSIRIWRRRAYLQVVDTEIKKLLLLRAALVACIYLEFIAKIASI